MKDNSEKTIVLPAEKVVDALLHGVTQETMNQRFHDHEKLLESRFDNINTKVDTKFEAMEKRFEQVDKRFEQVDKRFDKLEGKFDRLQWLIVGLTLTVFFKEHILKFFA
ncbi:hypothetical protein MD535_25750 [Vibrio sp. ZSDZ65]|uniref:DUF1640 domain-containing protein n=1 Tax=Vibrio qingdaonensis TaxID=2829491 RepID=A0A9X3CVV9_9VIBR|nr:hypothetical protein [Vibrio qingdaonensis]MCW8349380.1 hypothetical protein [Vibrio qingdaonensis]